uniref:SEC7 domain-containing protein n=1 Tax=Podarcis muralis TaxID=64176 RepID=A0A670KFW3_PODMU
KCKVVAGVVDLETGETPVQFPAQSLKTDCCPWGQASYSQPSITERILSPEIQCYMIINPTVLVPKEISAKIDALGIQFLIENDLLQNTPEDIAQFLYKGEGLNKTVIGDYLGERDDFNIKVLQAFVELHEFADLNLVQALR